MTATSPEIWELTWTILGEFLIGMLSDSEEGKHSSYIPHIFSKETKKNEWSRLFLEEEYSSQNKTKAGGVCIDSKKDFFQAVWMFYTS